MRSLPIKNGWSCRLRSRPPNFGFCPREQAKRSRSPAIRSITSGRAGSLMANVLSFRVTNLDLVCGCTRRMFLEASRRRFLRKGSMQRRLRFHQTASWLSGLAPIKKAISILQREVILESRTVWSRETFLSLGVRTANLFIFTGPARYCQGVPVGSSHGKKTVWKEIVPVDTAGVSTIGPILMTPDGKTYAYGLHRTLGDLYLVEGLK